MSRAGKVYLVGAGPGDAGLITVRGADCIGRADVIVYDYLANPALLKHARADAEIVYVGKTAGRHTLTQEAINELLVEKARAGRTVTRLKGGDPFVFGRGGEEAEQLRRAGIPFEVVPGVSSAVAAPACAGIPLTHRDCASAFMVLTGHEDAGKDRGAIDWAQVAAFAGTRVILMGAERIGEIAAELIGHGASADTPVAMVRWGTTSRQETIQGTLATIGRIAEQRGFKPPAVTVIGEVARLRERLRWFELRPLFGQRIVVTRSRQQASALARRLEELGGEVLEVPTIRILPPQDPGPLREAIDGIGEYDWLVFTSPNGVEAFFREFFARYTDLRELGAVRLAAIGTATAETLAALHLQVDLQPDEFTTERLLERFRKSLSCENLKFLLPRADLADERLARGLEQLGGIVDALDAYRTAPPGEDGAAERARLREEGADFVTFTSSSTVANFCRLMDVDDLRKRFPGLRFVTIGPQTTLAAREHGLAIAAEADPHTVDGLVEAVARLARRGKDGGG
jgi:uroporphyrinogen III methyltransferase/synthase